MKLHRFKAINTQKAMQKIHEVLGSEALIYSTKSTVDGVEVLAGLPYAVETCEVEEVTSAEIQRLHQTPKEKAIDYDLLSMMNQKIEQTHQQVQALARKMNASVTHFANHLSALASYANREMSYHLQIGESHQVQEDNVLQIFPQEDLVEDALNDEEEVLKRAEVAKSNWEKNRQKRQRFGNIG
ncbi:MAG: hypothetical protein WAW86_07320 [Gammaproteobacteria bacterium]